MEFMFFLLFVSCFLALLLVIKFFFLKKSYFNLQISYFEKDKELKALKDKFLEEEKQIEMLKVNLKQSQKMEAIGTLASGIAHDFNGLLQPIISCCELALKDTKNNSQENIRDIFQLAFKAKNLVAQILSFCNHQDKKRICLEFDDVIKDIMKIFKSSLPVNIVFKYDIEKNCKVFADPTEIHQVVMNLCINAFHSMAEKGGVLEVQVKSNRADFENINFDLEDCKNYVFLTVKDEGEGIDETLVDKIFKPFFTTKKNGEGTGLGLSIVYKIVKSLGGDITFKTKKNQGTVFIAVFPKYENFSESVEEPLGSEIYNFKGVRVLVVDDEKSVTKIFSKIFENFKISACVCNSAIKALDVFKNKKFDLLLTDLRMIEMNGLDFIRKVREKDENFPVILMSGNKEIVSEEDIRELKIDFVLQKPFSIEEILKIMKNALKKGALKN